MHVVETNIQERPLQTSLICVGYRIGAGLLRGLRGELVVCTYRHSIRSFIKIRQRLLEKQIVR